MAPAAQNGDISKVGDVGAHTVQYVCDALTPQAATDRELCETRG